MKREWRHTKDLKYGFLIYEDFKFTQEQRNEILNTIGKDTEGVTDFISGLELAVGYSLGDRTQYQNCLPKRVRQRLKKIQSSAKKLEEALTSIDDLSRDLIDSSHIINVDSSLLQTRKISQAAEVAHSFTEDFPKGRLPNLPQRLLAFQAAGAFEYHLKRTPTKTHRAEGKNGKVHVEGLFAKCLRTALRAAKFSEPGDLYQLTSIGIDMLNAVKNRSTTDNTEFELPEPHPS